MTAASSTSPDAARLVTPTMLVLWLALATVPLWIAQAGLYPYLGVEILIWSIYALAFNLVLLGTLDYLIAHHESASAAAPRPSAMPVALARPGESG